MEYWREKLFRPTYEQDGKSIEVQEWYVQIQHKQKRKKVGLGANNKEEACRRAARFYITLREKGWDGAFLQLYPDRVLCPKGSLTIGDYIEAVRPLLDVRQRTFETYAYALRKIARESLGLGEGSRRKFDPKKLGWRKGTDAIQLAKVTPEGIKAWKRKVVAAAEGDPQLEQRARRNINSFARNARALFGRKILKAVRERGYVLPDPLPFQDFEYEPRGNTRYVSKVDAAVLLQRAREELKKDPEMWMIILLALGAGLRRSEIDSLRWQDVDLNRAMIRVINHSYHTTKTNDSEAEIFVDPGMLLEIEQYRSSSGSDPVIESKVPFRRPSPFQRYRCQETFERVTKWLREHGVTEDKPLHTLRKEFGSIIYASADIYAASRQLRHSSLGTTAAFYTDNRKRATVPVLDLLTRPDIPAS